MDKKTGVGRFSLRPALSGEKEMNTATAEKLNNKSGLGQVAETVETIAEAGLDLGLLKKKLDHAIEETMLDAERIVKHSKRGIEDAIDDTTYLIKKNPWQSVGYVFAAGLGLGLLSGFLMGRKQ